MTLNLPGKQVLPCGPLQHPIITSGRNADSVNLRTIKLVEGARQHCP